MINLDKVVYHFVSKILTFKKHDDYTTDNISDIERYISKIYLLLFILY